jgi:hypothetical protein
MKITEHAMERMNTRGISKAMLDIVYAYGIDKGDKVVLTKKDAINRRKEAQSEKVTFEKHLDTGTICIKTVMFEIASLSREIDCLGKIIDKQGVAVIVVGETVITTYRHEKHKYQH